MTNCVRFLHVNIQAASGPGATTLRALVQVVLVSYLLLDVCSIEMPSLEYMDVHIVMVKATKYPF